MMSERALREVAKRHQEHILPPYDAMMDMDGFEAICEFVRNFGSSNVYVPSLRTIFGHCFELDIMKHYNGTNVRELVRKYGYSEKFVRNLIRRKSGRRG